MTPYSEAELRERSATEKIMALHHESAVELIPTAKNPQKLPTIVSAGDVLPLLQAASCFSHHVLMATMYGTGVRVSEAVHFSPERH